MVLTAASAEAVQVAQLYSATVQIPSQQGVDRSDGFNRALTQVLVKVTGDKTLASDPTFLSQLLPGEAYVQTFSYRENPAYKAYLEQQKAAQAALESEPVEVPATEEMTDAEVHSELSVDTKSEVELSEIVPEPFLLDVSFSESGINRKLSTLNIPVWGKARPSVLLWLVTEKDGERTLIGDGLFEHQAYLERVAEESGVPLFMPVADLVDVNGVDLSDVWALFPGAVDSVSERYRAEANVMMRLYSLPEGGWATSWLLQHGNVMESVEFTGDNIHLILEELIAHIGKVFSARYAVVRSDVAEGADMKIEISGIDSFEDYVLVQRYLNTFPPVAKVTLEWVDANSHGYSLTLNGSPEQFFEHLDLSRTLKRDTLMPESMSRSSLEIDPETAAANDSVVLVTEQMDLDVGEVVSVAEETLEPVTSQADVVQLDVEDSELEDKHLTPLATSVEELVFGRPAVRLVWLGNR